MLAVPHLMQRTAWSCGPACVRMVLKYFGEDVSEAELIDELGSDAEHGTSPGNLSGYLRGLGYSARATTSMGLGAIHSALRAGRPIVVVYQDWAHRPARTDYASCWDNGHYAVAIGANDGRITLCDPSSKRPRRHFAADEFLARWRDIGSGPNPKIYRQWGLSVGPKR